MLYSRAQGGCEAVKGHLFDWKCCRLLTGGRVYAPFEGPLPYAKNRRALPLYVDCTTFFFARPPER